MLNKDKLKVKVEVGSRVDVYRMTVFIAMGNVKNLEKKDQNDWMPMKILDKRKKLQ